MKLNLDQLITVHPYQIASRNLSKDLDIAGQVTLFAMAKGETISLEKASSQKMIVVLEGTITIMLDGAANELSAHDFLVIKQGQNHAFEALENNKFLQIQQD